MRCYFIEYPNHSKGYLFFFLAHETKIVESQVAKFLELDIVYEVVRDHVVDLVRHVTISLLALQNNAIPTLLRE